MDHTNPTSKQPPSSSTPLRISLADHPPDRPADELADALSDAMVALTRAIGCLSKITLGLTWAPRLERLLQELTAVDRARRGRPFGEPFPMRTPDVVARELYRETPSGYRLQTISREAGGSWPSGELLEQLRRGVADGAGHECEEWRDVVTDPCALCDRRHPAAAQLIELSDAAAVDELGAYLRGKKFAQAPRVDPDLTEIDRNLRSAEGARDRRTDVRESRWDDV